MNQKSKIYLFAIILLLSCEGNYTQDWYIGQYQLLDQTIPYPELLMSENNTAYLFNNKGYLIDTCSLDSSGFEKHDTLYFDDKSYRVCHADSKSLSIYDLNKPVQFYKSKDSSLISKNRAWFKKLSEYNLPELAETESLIRSVVWKYETYNETPNDQLTIKHYISFEKDELRHIRSYSYAGMIMWSEIERKSYFLFTKGQHQFLSKFSNADNPQPLLQITGVNKKSISMLNFSDIEKRVESLTLAGITKVEFESMVNRAKPYQNCSDGYVGEYYYNLDTYPKGNDFIKRWVSKGLPKSNENGSIIIHYNINCEGNIGRYGVQSMDMNFQSRSFSKDLVSHLMTRVSKLEAWPLIKNDIWWLRHKDVHGFLMFNFRKGKIVDVCP